MTLSNALKRHITAEEIKRYEEDGAAVIRDVLPKGWVDFMRDAIETILQSPGDASVEYTPEGKTGRYYGDFFLWRQSDDFERFMKDSPMPQLAAEVMGSKVLNFFYDQLLVKEPNTAEPTPWHQDLSYWPVKGQDILSIWVPFDKATEESGVVVYVKGSHKWGDMYAPATFAKDSGFGDIYAKGGLKPLPDIESNRDDYEILTWELDPGDVLIHHPLTLHYASGNASKTGRRRGLALRYLGEDAHFDNRPGTFIENTKVMKILPGFDMKEGDRFSDPLFPTVWPRR